MNIERMLSQYARDNAFKKMQKITRFKDLPKGSLSNVFVVLDPYGIKYNKGYGRIVAKEGNNIAVLRNCWGGEIRVEVKPETPVSVGLLID